MYTFKWCRELPIMQVCHISVCPSHKLMGKVSKKTHKKDKNEEGGEDCRWEAVSTPCRNTLDPVTRTLCGLLTTGRPCKEKPDRTCRISNEEALRASSRWTVLGLATLIKPVNGAGWDPAPSIWSLVIVLSQHLVSISGQSLGVEGIFYLYPSDKRSGFTSLMLGQWKDWCAPCQPVQFLLHLPSHPTFPG